MFIASNEEQTVSVVEKRTHIFYATNATDQEFFLPLEHSGTMLQDAAENPLFHS